MTPSALLSILHQTGVVLTVVPDERLQVDAPPGVMTPALRAALREHKAALLDLLAAFEERAALAEYDGGVPRAEAERLAWACVLGEKQPCCLTEERKPWTSTM